AGLGPALSPASGGRRGGHPRAAPRSATARGTRRGSGDRRPARPPAMGRLPSPDRAVLGQYPRAGLRDGAGCPDRPTLVAQRLISRDGPRGLDIDVVGGRAFVACDGGAVVAVELASGQELSQVPIFGEPDAVWYYANR